MISITSAKGTTNTLQTRRDYTWERLNTIFNEYGIKEPDWDFSYLGPYT